jgi:hypothetical protein
VHEGRGVGGLNLVVPAFGAITDSGVDVGKELTIRVKGFSPTELRAKDANAAVARRDTDIIRLDTFRLPTMIVFLQMLTLNALRVPTEDLVFGRCLLGERQSSMFKNVYACEKLHETCEILHTSLDNNQFEDDRPPIADLVCDTAGWHDGCIFVKNVF